MIRTKTIINYCIMVTILNIRTVFKLNKRKPCTVSHEKQLEITTAFYKSQVKMNFKRVRVRNNSNK